ELDSARSGDVARPFTEVRAGDVVCEREISADVETAGVDEVMQVEGVEELPAKLEVHFFADPGVLDERDVHVLKVRTPQIGDARSAADVPESIERRQRLERADIEERAFGGGEFI